MCTSQVAPGYWLPYYYHFQDKEQHKRRVKRSFEYYQGWMKIFKGILKCSVYEESFTD